MPPRISPNVSLNQFLIAAVHDLGSSSSRNRWPPSSALLCWSAVVLESASDFSEAYREPISPWVVCVLLGIVPRLPCCSADARAGNVSPGRACQDHTASATDHQGRITLLGEVRHAQMWAKPVRRFAPLTGGAIAGPNQMRRPSLASFKKSRMWR